MVSKGGYTAVDILITNEIKNNLINQQEFSTEDSNFYELLKKFCSKSGVAVEEFVMGEVMEDIAVRQEVYNKIPVDLTVYTTILMGDFYNKTRSHGSFHMYFTIHIEPSYPYSYWEEITNIKNLFHNYMFDECEKFFKIFPNKKTA
jgi:hypothetical protein